MHLETQKKAFWATTAVVGGGLGIWGLSALFSGGADEAKPQPAPVVVAAAPAKPVTQAAPTTVTAQPQAQPQVLPAPAKKGDNADEKAAKRAALQNADVPYMASQGFTLNSKLAEGYCVDGGGTDGSGWHGVSTGISYQATKNGQQTTVCVAHRGGKPTNYTTSFNAAVQQTPVAVTPLPAPAPAQPAPVKQGDNSSQKEVKLAEMLAEDRKALATNGFSIVSRRGVGYCLENGDVDTSGWHGVSSGISYEATKNGQKVKMCVAHKGGKPGRVTGSPM